MYFFISKRRLIIISLAFFDKSESAHIKTSVSSYATLKLTRPSEIVLFR